MTISEALGWKKTLTARHSELVRLRDSNAHVNHRGYGEDAPIVERPVYDAKALDKRITLISRDLRLLDESIKRTNAKVEIDGYKRDDSVLGELE